MEDINKLTDVDVLELYNDILESGQDMLAGKCIYNGYNSNGQPSFYCIIG